MKALTALILALAVLPPASAAIHTETIAYKHGDTVLEGFLAYDDSVSGPRPAVLIVHQWKGLGDYEMKRAEMLAQLGYNAFAVDIYGKGIRPKDSSAAGAEAGKYKRDRELLRAGADIAGVVSFHGGLDSPKPEAGRNIKCKVLALHGADDPFVPATDLAAFEDEMRNAGVDWQLIKYGGAVHSFTDWNAKGGMKGAQYNERADKRSWEDMKAFLAEIFK